MSVDNRQQWRDGAAIIAGIVGLQLAGWVLFALEGRPVNAARPWTWLLAFVLAPGRAVGWQLELSGMAALVPLAGALWLVRERAGTLYGEARFASYRDLVRGGLFADRGIVLGRWWGRYLVVGGTTHVLVTAPTRAGKGVGIVIPNLLTWSDSVVVLDIKHENHALTSAYRASHGQLCVLFDPVTVSGRTHRYNPLAYIDRDPLLAANDVQKIAHLLFPDLPNVDPLWTATPRSLFCGIVLLLLATPGKPVTLGQVLRETLVGGDCAAYLAGCVQERQRRNDPLPPQCVQGLASYYAIAADTTRAGVIASFRSRLELWNNPLIDAATSANDFDLRQLRRQRMSVYIGVTPDNLDRLAPLLNLFFQQLLDLNTRVLPEHDASLAYQCLVLPDEFAALGKVPALANGTAYLAAYGMRMLPIVQSPGQIVQHYGEHAAESFAANHAVRVVFPPKATETRIAADMAEWLGYRAADSTSSSRPCAWWKADAGSDTRSAQRRALLLPQEIVQLGRRRALVVAEDCPPILARRIRYYRERAFTRRLASVAPELRRPLGWPPGTRALQASVLRGALAAPVPILDLDDYRHEVGSADRTAIAQLNTSAAWRELDKFVVDFSAVPVPDPAKLDQAGLKVYADDLCRAVGIPVR